MSNDYYNKEKNSKNMNKNLKEFIKLIVNNNEHEMKIFKRYWKLFLLKFEDSNRDVLEEALIILMRMARENRLNELDNTYIIETMISGELCLDDYDILSSLNIAFYPKEYSETNKDEYENDLVSLSYLFKGIVTKANHNFVKMLEIYKSFANASNLYDIICMEFYNLLSIKIMEYFWINNEQYNLNDFRIILDKVTSNLPYFLDLFIANGFYNKDTKEFVGIEQLDSFMQFLFMKKGDINERRIYR